MLLNVRIGKEEEEIVKGLRRAKVNISALLRRAIREAAPAAQKERSRADIVREVLTRNPFTKSERVLPKIDLSSRKTMRAVIVKRLNKK